MKVTVDDIELWTVQEIVKSDLLDSDKFGIEVGVLRKMQSRHCEVLMELHQAKLDLEVAKDKLKVQNRFVIYA